jgi:two-component system response regulator
MSNGRVLVIEDNRDNMTLVTDMLELLGYDVVGAKDGQTGIELALSENPDLILMDLSLPILDGWTVTHRLKQNPDSQHIPIIALTAHAMTGDQERALRAGCNDYIAKPISMPELKIKIAKLLSSRNQP